MKPTKIFYLLAFAFIFTNCDDEPDTASIETLPVTSITPFSAESGGIISHNGIQKVLSQGLCWGKEENPTLADNYSISDQDIGTFQSEIINLNANFTFYARAFYTTSIDTVYGNVVEFITPDYLIFNPDLEYGTLTDVDGNVYKTITIGNQTWMAENLKVTHFRNGEPIPNETDPEKWGNFNITTSAYCWYNNDVSYKKAYGAMYNWYAASDVRNIAPEGWHIASVEDWQTLSTSLGNNGNRLRERTTAHWMDGNFNRFASNDTGFTAVAGGFVAPSGFGFMGIGEGAAYFWTNEGTWDGSKSALITWDITVGAMSPNCRGYNIRCVKD